MLQVGCEDDTMGGGDSAQTLAAPAHGLHVDMNESSWDRIVRTGV